MSKTIRNLLAASAFALAVPAATTASAQYTNEPFFDWTIVMSQGYGLEMALVRINVLEAIEGPVDPDLIEVVEQMAKGDWERFGGTLAARDPALARELHEYLEAFEEVLEDGDAADHLYEPTRALLAQAYDIVIDPAVRESPAYKGALIAQLLLAEGGVAEGYEEAEEEIFAYSMGWGALQRVKELWADIQGPLTDGQKDEANQLFGILDALYPQAAPPEEWVGQNPEEAEAPSQLLMGLVEVAADASLYAGRDLGRLAAHLADTVAPSCAMIAAGDDALAKEAFYPAADHFFGETTGLADLVNLFDEELFERAEAIIPLFALLEEDDDDDDESSASDDDDDDDDEEFEYGVEACEALVQTFRDAQALLGG
ncbi:MAG: hypothetical protein KIT43_11425 [Bauldia sp.]|nr:hypothetical protein [Bauldia sp.]